MPGVVQQLAATATHLGMVSGAACAEFEKEKAAKVAAEKMITAASAPFPMAQICCRVGQEPYSDRG
jgi:hypothetical protein